MSRREWRCRNHACATPHGAPLGRLTADGQGLMLDPEVNQFRVYLDTKKVVVVCPCCGVARDFRGSALFAHDADA